MAAMWGRVAQGWRPWRLLGWRRKTSPIGGPRPHLSVAQAVTGAGGGPSRWAIVARLGHWGRRADEEGRAGRRNGSGW
ncbi:hypothetical protein E2562_022811 [Oryza meyeriana var. granulata]|uniref:Uncharacterized protein n=1 Tax=Oryza meyeriana var. granulata TaxID=110450 RepID=A0A6G1FBA6_9ORYZ|nr:hypothetical protein E2562_022811 [Oryza meyeriana var. granulata]